MPQFERHAPKMPQFAGEILKMTRRRVRGRAGAGTCAGVARARVTAVHPNTCSPEPVHLYSTVPMHS